MAALIPPPQKTKRPVIGWFTNNITDIQQVTFWQHLSQAALYAGVDLVCYTSDVEQFAARIIQKASRGPTEIAQSLVDAVIVPDVALRYIPFLGDFIKKDLSKPVVCVMYPLEGVSAVLVDNDQAIRLLLTHLIETHGYRKIGFIGFNSQANNDVERFRAYQTVLDEHGLPFTSNLVEPDGYHLCEQGYAASVGLLLDERRLKPGIDIDALVCSNDWTAFHVIKALQARGLRVPEDIAVVGCDDLANERQVLPRLTTARLSLEIVAARAMELALALIERGTPPSTVLVPFEDLIIRESCGCALISNEPDQADVPDPTNLAQQFETAIKSNDWDTRERFLVELDSAARFAALDTGDPWKLQSLITHLHTRLCDGFSVEEVRRGCNLLDTTRLLVSEIVKQNEIRRRLDKEQIWGWVQEMERWLAAAVTEQEIANVLAQMLPRLGIRSFYISLYTSSKASAGDARLLVGMENGVLVPQRKDFERFSAQQLIPPGLGEKETPRNFIVEPLYYRENASGIMVIDTTLIKQKNVIAMLDILRGLLGSALVSVQLYQQALIARQVAEQMNKLKSQFLSQVSHELYTPINLIVNLSESLVGNGVEDKETSLRDYSKELETIRVTGQHLSYLVRDVLDLGRSQMGQLKLNWEKTDLVEVLQSAADVGQQLSRQKGLTWQVDFPSDLPFVWGDRTRLRQIILNLLSNACKFTAYGQVSLEAKVNGEVIVISVHDTGVGVPLHEQTSIFDEFRQSDRTAVRGYGGIGLGLAISRCLVELHGGSIGVKSSGIDDDGATFYFTLPIIDLRSKHHTETTQQAQPVVILTGKAHHTETLKLGLLRQGYQIEVIEIVTRANWLQDCVALCPGVIVIEDSFGEDQLGKIIQTIKNHPILEEIPLLFFAINLDQNTGAYLPLETMNKKFKPHSFIDVIKEKASYQTPSQITILVVDDDPDFLNVCINNIQAQLPTARILSARDGKQALNLMKAHQPDLVLLDLLMPVLDGFGVLEVMQSTGSLRNIPVIILTSISLTNDILKRLSLGVTKVLQKGIYSLDEIFSQMDAFLSKNKSLGSGPQRIARRAIVYIHEHYSEPISRLDIAQNIAVNESYLTRCFQRETGLTPMNYLNRYRIKQAKILLEQSHQKITEVGLSVGFSSSSQFSRAFRRETGSTPHEYQKGKCFSK